MMEKEPFNIVVLVPEGYIHSRVFEDLAQLLAASLTTLGHPVTMAVNKVVPTAVNVVLGYHMMEEPSVVRGMKWIPFQLEPMSDRDDRLELRWLDLLRAAPVVWDYDPTNIAYLKAHGIEHVRHVPLGFHPAFRRVEKRPADIDVLHYGSISPRRRPVLEKLQTLCRLKIAFGTYGAERDELVSRAKVVLNMHQFDTGIFEQVRVSYLLNNGRCVVCEESAYNPYPNMTAMVPYGQLVDRCMQLVDDEMERAMLAEQGRKRFEAMAMTDIVAGAIAGIESI